MWIEIWVPIHPAPVLLFYLSNKTVACDKKPHAEAQSSAKNIFDRRTIV